MIKPPIFIITDTLPDGDPLGFLVNISENFFLHVNASKYNQLIGLCSNDKWPFYKQDYCRRYYPSGSLPGNLMSLASLIRHQLMKCFNYPRFGGISLYEQAIAIYNIIRRIDSGSIVLLSTELAMVMYNYLKSHNPK